MSERYLLYLPVPVPESPWSQVLRALRARRIRRSIGIVRSLCARCWRLASSSGRERILNKLFPNGLSHNSRNLQILIQEAQYLGRTIVLAPLVVPSHHNLDRCVVSAVGEYYDLSRSHVRLADGQEVVPKYIKYRDFIRRRDVPSFWSAKFVAGGEEIDRQTNERYPLIVRYTDGHAVKSSFSPGYNLGAWENVHLQVSETLSRMAEDTSTELDSYCFLQWRAPWDRHIPLRLKWREPWDAQDAVHAGFMSTRIDKLTRRKWPVVRHFMDGESLCGQLAKVFPRSSKLYIAANIWRPYDEAYFGPLRALYRVYRCYDFPQLARLAEGPERNTSKLNLIENIIGEHAAHRLHVHPWQGFRLAEMQRIVDLPEANQ